MKDLTSFITESIRHHVERGTKLDHKYVWYCKKDQSDNLGDQEFWIACSYDALADIREMLCDRNIYKRQGNKFIMVKNLAVEADKALLSYDPYFSINFMFWDDGETDYMIGNKYKPEPYYMGIEHLTEEQYNKIIDDRKLERRFFKDITLYSAEKQAANFIFTY